MNCFLAEVENSRFFDLVQPNLPLPCPVVISSDIFWLIFQADQICYAVLCVFSYVAAGHKKKADLHRKPRSESMSPRGARYSSMTWVSPPASDCDLHISTLYSGLSLDQPRLNHWTEIKIARLFIFIDCLLYKLCFSEIHTYISLYQVKLTIII